MNITTTSIDPYSWTAHIELDTDELKKYIEQAKEAIAESITVEGFRKGKAPKNIVEQQVGVDAVRSEALELALEGSFAEAVKSHEWDVLRTGDLKVEKNDAEGLKYSLRVDVWPSVVVPDLTAIQVPKKVVEVSDAEIAEALDTVVNMRATFLDKAEPSLMGDRVEVDFDAALNGVAVEGGSSRNHPLVIGGKSFMPGFEEELVGLAPGETKKFSLVAPEDYYEKSLAGKAIDFTVTMRRVQSVLKPAADDAFAVSLGSFKNLQELRASLRAGITREKSAKEQQRIRLAILDEIIRVASVPAPEAMVRDELNDMIHRFGHDLQSKGMELSMYLARMKKTEEDLRKDWKPEAERQVRITQILRAVAHQKEIKVSAEELEETLNATIAELIKQGQATEADMDPQRIRSALYERMLTDKTLAFLESTCAHSL